jgi:hypothetical protein
MACDLTRGRLEECKESVGGIDKIYFINYGELGDITYGTEDQITVIAGTFSAYAYELKSDNNTFEQTITSDRNNGTTYFEQVLNIGLKKLTREDHKEIKLLAYGRPHIVVEDNNGNQFLMGVDFGADVTGGTVATGGAKGDMSGYTLTFTAQEKRPASFIGNTGQSLTDVATNVTIVSGT